jgi:hypothetical protein
LEGKQPLEILPLDSKKTPREAKGERNPPIRVK